MTINIAGDVQLLRSLVANFDSIAMYVLSIPPNDSRSDLTAYDLREETAWLGDVYKDHKNEVGSIDLQNLLELIKGRENEINRSSNPYSLAKEIITSGGKVYNIRALEIYYGISLMNKKKAREFWETLGRIRRGIEDTPERNGLQKEIYVYLVMFAAAEMIGKAHRFVGKTKEGKHKLAYSVEVFAKRIELNEYLSEHPDNDDYYRYIATKVLYSYRSSINMDIPDDIIEQLANGVVELYKLVRFTKTYVQPPIYAEFVKDNNSIGTTVNSLTIAFLAELLYKKSQPYSDTSGLPFFSL